MVRCIMPTPSVSKRLIFFVKNERILCINETMIGVTLYDEEFDVIKPGPGCCIFTEHDDGVSCATYDKDYDFSITPDGYVCDSVIYTSLEMFMETHNLKLATIESSELRNVTVKNGRDSDKFVLGEIPDGRCMILTVPTTDYDIGNIDKHIYRATGGEWLSTTFITFAVVESMEFARKFVDVMVYMNF